MLKKIFMKAISYVVIMLLLIGTSGCKKDPGATTEEVFTKFPPPTWRADETGKYPASMTAVVAIPATLQRNVNESDQLAAFINNECRGDGVRVKVDTTYVYFILIRGLADEQSKIVFKYYSAKSSYLYQTQPVVSFLVDDVYGTAQNPKELALSPVK